MLRTKNGLPKHCSLNEDRHGRKRVRFRMGGFSTYLTGTPWSEDFMRQYAAALDGVKAATNNIGAERTQPGSFNALAVLYYRSPEFRNLKASTQKTRRRTIEGFRHEHGEKPLKHLGRQHIKAIIGAKAATPESANTLLKVLRLMLAVAVDIGMIEQNPAAGIKRFKSRGEGFHTWSEDEITRFEVQHPIGSKARLAFTLLLYTAQRRSDVMRMGWQHVRNDQISVRQAKTDKVLLIPMHPELTRVLGAVPKENLTFLLTDRGAPFSATGFGGWFRRQCDEAGLPDCSAHGLRKAAATRLANAGCSTEQIKAITGHKSLSEVARYTAAADQVRLARKAIGIQIGAEREQALSNLATRLDKTERK